MPRSRIGSVKWYGDELLAKIRQASPESLYEAGELLAGEAAADAPRASGRLAESGYVGTTEKSTYTKRPGHFREYKAGPGQAVVGFAMFYARFVELGTARRPAQPFLRPALGMLGDRMGRAYANASATALARFRPYRRGGK